MIGSNKRKRSNAKDPEIVAGTGGFAATLKILQQVDNNSSPVNSVGAKLSPMSSLRYANIKRSETTLSSDDSSYGSKTTNLERRNLNLPTR